MKTEFLLHSVGTTDMYLIQYRGRRIGERGDFNR